MNQIQTIPLAKLKASPLNVRKTGGKKIEELAASIRASGLQQNLGVVPTGDSFGVVFGGRRLRALQQLHKAGELPDALVAGVPCRVVDESEAQEASLAENTIREAMHPLDQFNAFQALVDDGKDEAEVAARFGVTETVVKQRLRLARVSPKLLQAYGDGDMTLEQLQAFAVTEDTERQEAHWKQVRGSSYQSEAASIRRDLLRSEVSQTDDRVKLVGLDAYTAAGGRTREDMFSDAVVLLDIHLLDKLAAEALEEVAALVRAEGWSWVEVGGERPNWNSPKVAGTGIELTEADCAEIDAFEEKDPMTAADWVRLSWLEDSTSYTEEEKGAAGARVMLNHGLTIYRGLLRDGEVAPAREQAGEQQSEGPASTVQVGTHERTAKVPGEPSFGALQRLQAEASAIVQLQVAKAPHIAMALLVARLAADLYDGYGGPRRWVCIGREASGRAGGPHRAVVAEGPYGERLDALNAEWKAKLPRKAEDLAAWAVEQSPQDLQQLLAFLVAREIDAVDWSPGAKDGVVQLAAVARADIAAEWRPTEEWLSTLPKPVIVAMVADAAGKKAADPLEKLKKGELPAAALPLFPEGWIPKQLRPAEKPRKEKAPRGKAAAAGDVE
ncbi:ParB/RepB/Spo0J family partition protein [Luteimonas sp. MJ174]|uniref:ParB/RepB/Spo0J family partition protein n=1 Tax=Luteimonas sp. MJ174 TaxID=3129237 RepID=UPI0031BB1081